MLLLYKDPKGETIGSIIRVQPVQMSGSNDTTGSTLAHQTTTTTSSSTDWEKRVALLEKKLSEKDIQIAQLQKQLTVSAAAVNLLC